MKLKDMTLVNKDSFFKKPGYAPDFYTFPMSDSEKTTEVTSIYEPSLEDINVCKDWVDFKEM